jgi:hypothetical protein
MNVTSGKKIDTNNFYYNFGLNFRIFVKKKNKGVLTYFVLLRVIFWVAPRRVVFNSRRFGTLCLFHLHRRVLINP